MRLFQPKTLKQRQMETGRTLSLNGKAWRDLREVVLHRDPLCVACGAPATDVDHIDNDPTDNRLEALQSLCHSCHSHKTQTGKLPTIYGEDGLPTTGPWANMVADLQVQRMYSFDEKSPATEASEPTGTP